MVLPQFPCVEFLARLPELVVPQCLHGRLGQPQGAP